MLKFLHIENIAVIEQSDIEFKAGFNVLTGETGAGKSILIDAINAVLGERVSKDLVRNGCDSALVSAVFGDLDAVTLNILKQMDVLPDDDGNILITRKLSLSGKGLIKVNGIPVTATVLREISRNLINIHGQHDNQALLVPENHLSYIDAIANNSNLLDNYYAEFKNLNAIRKELRSLEMDEDEKARKIDILKYQIAEIEAASIKIGEIDTLKNQLKIADSYEKTFKALTNAEYILSGDDNNDGVLTQLRNADKQLNIVEVIPNDKLQEALTLLEDLRSDIGGFLNNSEYGSLNSDEINQRLDYVTRIVLKYGGSEEKALEFFDNAAAQLEAIQLSDKRIIELSDLLDSSTSRLIFLAEELTQNRKQTALLFERQVCDILNQLNMPNVRFAVDFQKGKYTKLGCDNVEFMISANMGENLKPLHKIASGGELSRVMLAIKSVLLDNDPVGTMIFDEIDTGISGYAADKVAKQLRFVANGRQVICVTHLAQIAAAANEHLLIEKNTQNGKTFTNVSSLGYEEKIHEIARIMSGTDITENLYNSAKELIDRSF
ncbi:MAG: DNA repair protein RecN [Ruminococcaceae bacterium]|nr:DNA repair protein RecN [Oscillospiraceae bacterium]